MVTAAMTVAADFSDDLTWESGCSPSYRGLPAESSSVGAGICPRPTHKREVGHTKPVPSETVDCAIGVP